MRKFVVHENSMQPSLHPGDRLLAKKGAPRVGDVVVFPEPAAHRFYVKRVVAGCGTRVEIDGTTLTIETAEGSSVIGLPHAERRRSWVLSEDEVYVLSDDLSATRADSRVLGPVDTDGMFIAILRYAPVRRLGIRF